MYTYIYQYTYIPDDGLIEAETCCRYGKENNEIIKSVLSWILINRPNYSMLRPKARAVESNRLCSIAICGLETSQMRRPWPALGRSLTGGGGGKSDVYIFLLKQNNYT
jgi:hypothetical protein